MQISGKELAKTVVLWTGEEMILAVLPAPNHVRLDKLAAEVESLRASYRAGIQQSLPRLRAGRHAAIRVTLQLALCRG